jgi:hypothetical protein
MAQVTLTWVEAGGIVGRLAGTVHPPFSPVYAVIWCIIEVASALAPITVTPLGSSLKQWMCSCIHSKTSLWSYRLTFAVPLVAWKVGPEKPAKRANAIAHCHIGYPGALLFDLVEISYKTGRIGL